MIVNIKHNKYGKGIIIKNNLLINILFENNKYNTHNIDYYNRDKIFDILNNINKFNNINFELSNKRKYLILIRHGESEHNYDLNFNKKNPLLTERGKKQALKLKNIFDSIKNIINLEIILSSPLFRTLETTKILFHDYNIPKICVPYGTEDHRCIYDTGDNLDITKKKYPNFIYPDNYNNLCNSIWNRYENEEDIKKRTYKFRSYINSFNNNIVFVSHSGFIKRILHYQFNFPLIDIKGVNCTFKNVFYILDNCQFILLYI
jgi:broad specificity phosphatase PhoE